MRALVFWIPSPVELAEGSRVPEMVSAANVVSLREKKCVQKREETKI